jgi:hypothetical protein
MVRMVGYEMSSKVYTFLEKMIENISGGLVNMGTI